MSFKDYKNIEKKYNIGGGDWLKLEDGDNKIRIVSEFFDFAEHFIKSENKSYTCLGKKGNCKYCESGLKPTVKFLGWVLDREDGAVKLLRVGYMIYKQIGALAMSDEYGFDGVPEYDITIKKSGKELGTEYQVLPARKNTELTKDEEKLVKEKTKKTPEEIVEKMKEKVSEDIPVIEDEEAKTFEEQIVE